MKNGCRSAYFSASPPLSSPFSFTSSHTPVRTFWLALTHRGGYHNMYMFNEHRLCIYNMTSESDLHRHLPILWVSSGFYIKGIHEAPASVKTEQKCKLNLQQDVKYFILIQPWWPYPVNRQCQPFCGTSVLWFLRSPLLHQVYSC